MEFIKKYKFILIGLLVVILGCLVYFFLIRKPVTNETSNGLNFRIINNNTDEDKGKSYFLYSDQNYSYYLKDNNPDKVFILISSNGILEDEMYKISLEMFKNNETEFNINGSDLRINNVKYCLYKWEITIDEFNEKMEVEKVPLNNIAFKATDYKKKENSNRTLYYTDENGVKIYNENLEKIEVNDIDLAKFLKDNNLPSDYVYNIFKEEESNIDNPVYLIGDSTKPTMIKATQYKNLKLSCYFENNEIFYVLSYEEERAKE